jgi:hypothetical protein
MALARLPRCRHRCRHALHSPHQKGSDFSPLHRHSVLQANSGVVSLLLELANDDSLDTVCSPCLNVHVLCNAVSSQISPHTTICPTARGGGEGCWQ